METGTSQVWNTGLECVEAIVARQQRTATKSNDAGLLLCGENG